MTRCCRSGFSPTWTPRSPGWADPTSARSPSTGRRRPVNDMLRDGMHQQAVHGGVAPVPAQLAGRRLPVPRRSRCGGFHRRARGSWPPPSRNARTPPSFDDHYSQARLFFRSLSPGGAGPRHPGLHVRTGQVLRESHPGTAAAALANVDAGPVRRRGQGPGPARSGGDRTGAGRPTRAPRCPRSARPGPLPAGWWASWPTRAATLLP